jgi:hypothetical protein
MYGNVTENRHEVADTIGRLVGGMAAVDNLERQKRLIYLLRVLDEVEKLSGGWSVDKHLRVLDQIQLQLKEM